MKLKSLPLLIRYAKHSESRLLGLAKCSDWLTAAERRELALFRAADRRADWLAGRWLGKQLISQATGSKHFSDIEILTRDACGRGMRSQIRLCEELQPWSLSLSHAGGGVLVGLTLSDRLSLGADLACDVPHDQGFRRQWFTQDEQRWLAQAPETRTAILWGLKEAIYKACGDGRPWMPKQIEIQPNADRTFNAVCFGRQLHRPIVHLQLVERGFAVVVVVSRKFNSATFRANAHGTLAGEALIARCDSSASNQLQPTTGIAG